MEHLPPVGWADVATKRDLDALRETNRLEHEAIRETNRLGHELLKQSIETSEHRVLAALQAEMIQQTRTMVFATLTALIGLGGLVLGAVRLFA